MLTNAVGGSGRLGLTLNGGLLSPQTIDLPFFDFNQQGSRLRLSLGSCEVLKSRKPAGCSLTDPLKCTEVEMAVLRASSLETNLRDALQDTHTPLVVLECLGCG